MALSSITVVKLSPSLPGQVCGRILTDFGATVIQIDNINDENNYLRNGKQSIALNLKNKKGVDIVRKLSQQSDVFIDNFRPGIMESLGLGPKILLGDNPKLIYARLSGYGQTGCLSKKAGHDINFSGLNGLLSFHRENEKPNHLNLLSASSGIATFIFGITMALYERSISGKGQIIDCSLVECAAYSNQLNYLSPLKYAINVHYYEIFETKDGKFMSVASVEPKFYSNLLQTLNLDEKLYPQSGDTEKIRTVFKNKFLEKTQKEWRDVFKDIDACVSPVLTPIEAAKHQHNIERKTFLSSENEDLFPNPVPKFSRTPGTSNALKPQVMIGQHTEEILKNLNYSDSQICEMENEGIIKRILKSKI